MIQTSPKWYLQHCTVNRWHVQHSIIVNVTWRRFNQSAKHTTMNYVWFWQNDFMHCPCSITSRRVSFPVYCSLCHSLRGLVFAWLAKASYDRPRVFWRESVCALDHVSLNVMVVHAHTTFWWCHVYYMICWVTRTVNSGFSWLGGDVCRELSWWRRSVSWCWCDVGMISVTTDVTVLYWFMDCRGRAAAISVPWRETQVVLWRWAELSRRCGQENQCFSTRRVFRQMDVSVLWVCIIVLGE